MRVLILANSAGGLYGFRGELLQELIMHSFNVFFAVPQTKDDLSVQRIESIGCQFIHTPMNRRGINPIEDLRLIRRYLEVSAEVDPDLILTYTIKPNIYGNYVGSRLGIPVISNITGVGSSLFSGKFKYIVKRMYKYACKRASSVFFQNQGNLDFFLRSKMIDSSKARLIPGSGVNIENFRPMQKANEDDGIIRFLYIGRIMREKGIEEYLEAANRIAEQFPDTEFQILGSYEEDQYREIMEKNPGVRYLGISDDVREQIREADCIVHPSYHEGMSNVLLEGAAMGKPLLASNIPGCKEIVDHGTNGYLFEPRSSDSLIEALETFIQQDNASRNEMGLKSRKKIEDEFDRKYVVQAYLRAIHEIVDRK